MPNIYKIRITELDRKIARSKTKRAIEVNGLAWRGDNDGDARQKFVGTLGEVVVCRLLGESIRVELGYDGGYDVMVGNYGMDIKTSSYPITGYGTHHYIYESQIDLGADGYIFARYDQRRQLMYVCGYIFNEAVVDSMLYRAGELPPGYKKPLDYGRFIVSQTDLRDFKDLAKYAIEQWNVL